MSEPVLTAPCPTCRAPVQWSPASEHRPFCSERCQLIDFGGWADERYRIAGEAFRDVTSEDLRDD